MIIKTKVGISARHIHLTKDDYITLFGKEELTYLKSINQVGQFAACETVTIKTEKSSFENVRILGPFRNYTQIEISKTDAYKLGINPPVRKSGDISNSSSITLIGPKGEITKDEGCIIADRHIHITKEIASKYNISEGQSIMVNIDTIKKGKVEAFARISDDAYFEMHLDTDDANAFLLNNGDEVDIEI